MKDVVSLFTIHKDVFCIKCGHIGAVRSYGQYGNFEEHEKVYADKHGMKAPYLNHTGGWGGTIPYECTNCGSVGLEGAALEGYQVLFKKIEEATTIEQVLPCSHKEED